MDRHARLVVLPLALLAACAQPQPARVVLTPPPAQPAPPPAPAPQAFMQCVPYARQVSGIEIFGDAWSWWQGAAGRYERGARPLPGAVLVMKRDARLAHGHVSVVTAIVAAREIRVTHANWGYAGKPRGQVDRDVSIIDVSPNNDWSEVKVWNGGSYGRVYPSYGFIYPGSAGQAI
jgi:surface antigen